MWSTRLFAGRALLADGVLALLLAAVGVTTSIGGWSWQPTARHLDLLGSGLIAAAALPLTVRRVWSLSGLLASAAATTAYLVIGYPYGLVQVSLAVAVYSLAAWRPLRPAAVGAAAALAMLMAHVLARAVGGADTAVLASIVPGSAWVVVPFAVGQVVRLGRDAAARNRADEVSRLTYEERLRVAQEVHDVVGHGLAAINMQAEIALHLLAKRPEQAETALATIGRTSKVALDELRTTLAVVRQHDAAAGRSPGPSIADIDGLVARVRAAGVAVTVTLRGTGRDLPAAIDQTAYRIIQEALTNVLRHSGPAAAMVRLDHRSGELVVEVTDNGRGGSGAGTGHGIPSMRARTGALGGIFEAGPRPGQGFRVRAALPLPAPAPRRSGQPVPEAPW